MVNITETEKEVLRVINNRFELGRKKYGEGISYKQDPGPDRMIRWINEAIEECADQLQYLVALRLTLENLQVEKVK